MIETRHGAPSALSSRHGDPESEHGRTGRDRAAAPQAVGRDRRSAAGDRPRGRHPDRGDRGLGRTPGTPRTNCRCRSPGSSLPQTHHRTPRGHRPRRYPVKRILAAICRLQRHPYAGRMGNEPETRELIVEAHVAVYELRVLYRRGHDSGRRLTAAPAWAGAAPGLNAQQTFRPGAPTPARTSPRSPGRRRCTSSPAHTARRCAAAHRAP